MVLDLRFSRLEPLSYGGKEFTLFLGQTSQFEAGQVAERVHGAVAGLPIDLPGAQQVWITISQGIATLTDEHQDLIMLIKSADEALYSAKAPGRNQISVWKCKKKIVPQLFFQKCA